MSANELIRATVEALRAQGTYAMDADGVNCSYRGPNGVKCAVGLHIADEDYRTGWEGNPLDESAQICSALQTRSVLMGRGLTDEELSALVQLQRIHDSCAAFYKPFSNCLAQMERLITEETAP